MGSQTMGSCSVWLLVCVTTYLIPQLLPALGLANVARILTDTVVPSAPLSHPSPVLLSQAKSLGMLLRVTASLWASGLI